METLGICIASGAAAIGAYVLGYMAGEAEGFDDGMDAAIEVYEEELKTLGMQMMIDPE